MLAAHQPSVERHGDTERLVVAFGRQLADLAPKLFAPAFELDELLVEGLEIRPAGCVWGRC